MAGSNVVWKPQVVEEMLRYYKEKIQSEGRQFVFKEVHHEECAQKINQKFSTTFTQRQVYHKFHKLKAQWKVILEAKNLSGANFDDVEKMILYEESEVIRMTNNKDRRAKYINTPIRFYDEMEFIFQDKHATGEFTVLQTPFDHPSKEDNDILGDKNAPNNEEDPAMHYDSDCLPEQSNNNEGSASKRPTTSKRDKGKRVKTDDLVVKDITSAMRDMSEAMRLTHMTNPNESLFKIVDGMEELPMLVRLEVQSYLANNEKIASMLKERPLDTIKQFVLQWVIQNCPTSM